MGSEYSIDKSGDFYSDDSNVPLKSIKKSYDVYTGRDWTNPLHAEERLGVSPKGGNLCNHGTILAKDLFTPNGKTRKGKHRDLWCRNYKILGINNVDCGDCDFYPQDRDPSPDRYLTSVKVPVGQKLTITTGTAGTNSKEETTTCDFGVTDNTDRIKWGGWSDFKGVLPDRLPEDVATGCSSGAYLGKGQYAETTNNYQIKHTPNQNDDTKSNKCFIGVKSLKKPGLSVCIDSDVDWDTFCQLGDNVETNLTCKQMCQDCKNGKCSKKSCEYALERLCSKKKGDPLKRDYNKPNDTAGAVTNSLTDYMKTDKQCQDFCGTARDPYCKNVKNDLCSDSKDFLKYQWLPEYCKAWWQDNNDITAMNNSCRDTLLDKNSGQDIFSGKGCGALCLGDGLDVNKNWCRDRKLEYCTKSDENMLTNNCWKFCSEPENAGLCDNYLDGNRNGMCNRLGIKTEEDLRKPVEGTNRQLSDWCGCTMPTAFYEKIGNDKIKAFQDFGYAVNGSIDYSPECSFPLCKIGSIKTNPQQERLANQECTDCVQIMLNNVSIGTNIDSDFAAEQEMNCPRIVKKEEPEPEPLPPGFYNMNNTRIQVFDDKSYCTYKTEEDFVKAAQDKEITQIITIPSLNPLSGECKIQNDKQDNNQKPDDVVDVESSVRSVLTPQEEEQLGIGLGSVIGLIALAILIYLAIAYNRGWKPFKPSNP